MNRRTLLKTGLASLGLLTPPGAALARWLLDATTADNAGDAGPGNFHRVYGDPELRDRFFLFLQNVFHLYPELKFHELIGDLTAELASDREIYLALLERIPKLKPPLGTVTHALPALAKQKDEMTRQSLELLGQHQEVNGYLEIGTTGRYVSSLDSHVVMKGPTYLLNDVAPSYSPTDIAERGRLRKRGHFIPLGSYDAFAGDKIPAGSLDLVTNFIGFHHCPDAQLAGFVASIRDVLRPGGRLLLRDHDVDGEAQWALVALAHDVYNAGVFLSWDANHSQLRHFRSIPEWRHYLEAAGIHAAKPQLAQALDPTRNLLLEFVKV
jgi:SAM-dependent methyltransferase